MYKYPIHISHTKHNQLEPPFFLKSSALNLRNHGAKQEVTSPIQNCQIYVLNWPRLKPLCFQCPKNRCPWLIDGAESASTCWSCGPWFGCSWTVSMEVSSCFPQWLDWSASKKDQSSLLKPTTESQASGKPDQKKEKRGKPEKTSQFSAIPCLGS